MTSKRAGFSPSFISQVENGQASPSMASLDRIAAVLDVTLAAFFSLQGGSEVALDRAGARPSFRSSWSRARSESVDALMLTRSFV